MELIKLSDAQLNIWWRECGRILHEKNLDRSTRLLGAQFGHLWNLCGKPKGLEFSERELGKMFDMFHQQVHICLKRLETFGYIKIEDSKHRRKLYIPTEKLTGEKIDILPPLDRGDVSAGTPEPGSSDYVLYNKPLESTSYPPDYAESTPKWKDIQQIVSAKLKACDIGQAYLPSFKEHFEHRPIPLRDICNIVETFAKAKKFNQIKKSEDSYIIGAFIKAQESNIRSKAQKTQGIEVKKAKQTEQDDKNVVSLNYANTELAYRLNTDKKIVDSDIPKKLLKRLLDFERVVVDPLGFVERNRNVLFYLKQDQPYLFSATFYDIEALKRSGVNIPGEQKLLESIK